MENSPYWLRLLNVRYLIFRQPLEPLPPFLREAFRGSQIVYENLFTLPRATLVDRFQVVSPDTAILDSVAVGRSDSQTLTYLTAPPPGGPLGPVGNSQATIVSYRLNDVTVDTQADGPALLRLADLWYPDWSATVDGKPAPVLRADYLLRAVPVPAGKHRVVFTYRSAAVRTGMMLSVACALVALVLIGVGLWKRPRSGLPQEGTWKS
jgi:hypothetical protein